MSETTVKLFHAIVAGAAGGGVDPHDLLAAAGIDPADLADPDGRLPLVLVERLWHEAVRLTGDDCFGLHLAERLPIEAFGALGFALRSSATLGDAYARMVRYFRLVVHGPVVDLVLDGDVVRLRHEPAPGAVPPSRHAVECLMANLLACARRGLDAAFSPRSVSFRHAAPPRTEEHHRLLGPRVRFEQPRDELVLDRAALGSPQAWAEPALGAILEQQLSTQLAALAAVPQGFLDRVRAALAAELPHGEPALAALAERLRMSPRSLQRRLQQEESSLSSILDRLRADLAVRRLGESHDSITEVAFLLGYSDVSTFHRAFKRWTGLSPAAYRKDFRGEGGGAQSQDLWRGAAE
jgi:AraC-like DNA-binding protein